MTPRDVADVTVTSACLFRGRERRIVTIVIPIRTENPLNGSHRHWAVRARVRREQRQTVGLVMAGALRADGFSLPPETPPQSRQDALGTRFGGGGLPRVIRVEIARLAPSSGLDDDNLRAALKSVRDGIADAMGTDDRDPRIEWAYTQRRSERGNWAVEIRIETAAGWSYDGQ